MTKISVVIPVYNCEKYLSECLDSIINQTYCNLEIICVNDGSSDNSLSILNNYAAKDTRISVYSQENLGVSIARNFGFSKATGDYVSFIDADDFVELDLYQIFIETLNELNNPVDMFVFNVKGYTEGVIYPSNRVYFEISDWNNHTSNTTIHTFMDCKRPFSRNLSAENKIYNVNFLKENNITFLPRIKYEDMPYHTLTSICAKSILVTDRILLLHREFAHKSLTLEQSPRVFDIFKVTDYIEQILRNNNVYEYYKYAFFQFLYRVYLQKYFMCPQDLRAQYFNEMKLRLLVEEQQLSPDIYTKLSNFSDFLLVKNSSFEEFEKICAKAEENNKIELKIKN